MSCRSGSNKISSYESFKSLRRSKSKSSFVSSEIIVPLEITSCYKKETDSIFSSMNSLIEEARVLARGLVKNISSMATSYVDDFSMATAC